MTKRKIKQDVYPLELILGSMVGATILSRLIIYLILIKRYIPQSFLFQIKEFRLHHFVYGNLLILITSFMVIGLGNRRHKKLFAILYGIGIGLVLDEFLLLMGDVRQLNNNVLFIPYSIMAVSVVSLVIASIIIYRLIRDKRIK
jgi:hypothetical protein